MPRPVSLLARFGLILLLGAVTFAGIGALLAPAVAKLPSAASFEAATNVALPPLSEGSTVLDMNGEPMGELVGAENRVVVPLSAISNTMRRAVIANEDENFYGHNGVSPRGIARALVANSAAGGVAQGGSTITQQLVKLSLVGDDRTIGRKLQEASLALQLENQLCEGQARTDCKDRILEQYLNQVYLGRGVYGVEAAAQMYFGVSAADLDWHQAALLASIIPNPAQFDPIRHPERSKERRGLVIERLVATGDLTEEEAELYAKTDLPDSARPITTINSTEDLSYFERKVRDELLQAEWLAPTVELRRYLIFSGGLKITSTMDPRAQVLADAAALTNPVARANPEAVVALASVEPSNGAVRAVVGDAYVEGKGIVETALPKVGRSPGSAFKTFTLIAALEEGHSIRDTISAAPAPRKLYDRWGLSDRTTAWPAGCKDGTMDLRRATASSNNCAFVRLQAAVGGDKVVDVARRLGIDTITDAAEDNASLTLGSTTVRPVDMAAAYAALANDGRFNPPHFVTKVEDRDGNVLFEYEPPNEQVIPVEVARAATVALEGVVTGGTYKGGSLPGRQPAAGKTGTNELEDGGNADVWFVGYTPQMATAVWIGNPIGNTEMRGSGVQGGTAAAKVWREFMSPYLEGSPVVSFEDPDVIKSGVLIKDPWNGSSSSSSSRTTTTVRRSGGSSRTTTTAAPTTSPPTTASAPQEPADEPESPPAPSPEPGAGE